MVYPISALVEKEHFVEHLILWLTSIHKNCKTWYPKTMNPQILYCFHTFEEIIYMKLWYLSVEKMTYSINNIKHLCCLVLVNYL